MKSLFKLFNPRNYARIAQRDTIDDGGYLVIYGLVFVLIISIQAQIFSKEDVFTQGSTAFSAILGLAVFVLAFSFELLRAVLGRSTLSFLVVEKVARVASFCLLLSLVFILSLRYYFGSYRSLLASLDLTYSAPQNIPSGSTLTSISLIGISLPTCTLALMSIFYVREFLALLAIACGVVCGYVVLRFVGLSPAVNAI